MKLIMRAGDAIKTSSEDPVNFYFTPFLGYFYRKRLSLSLACIENMKTGRILEAGYGSGIFMPELSRHCDALFGIDTHPHNGEVSEKLKGYVQNVTLLEASIYKIPFPDNYFDAVVAVSILEHLKDLDNAVCELKRVLKPGGIIVAGAPVKNKFMDTVFSSVLKFNSDEHHPNGHRKIAGSLKKHFEIEYSAHFPGALPVDWGMYFVTKAKKI